MKLIKKKIVKETCKKKKCDYQFISLKYYKSFQLVPPLNALDREYLRELTTRTEYILIIASFTVRKYEPRLTFLFMP